MEPTAGLESLFVIKHKVRTVGSSSRYEKSQSQIHPVFLCQLPIQVLGSESSLSDQHSFDLSFASLSCSFLQPQYKIQSLQHCTYLLGAAINAQLTNNFMIIIPISHPFDQLCKATIDFLFFAKIGLISRNQLKTLPVKVTLIINLRTDSG